MRRLIIGTTLLLLACSTKKPWDVKDAPTTPPDLQYRTGHEVGSDIYVWRCYKNERVVVSQGSSALCGASAPRMIKGPCGALPEDEAERRDDERYDDVPDTLRWPGSPPPAPRRERSIDASADH